MFSLISGFCFIQAATSRLCFGLALVMAAYTARSEEGSFAPDLDILTIQPVRSATDWLSPYQFSASVVLTRSPDTAPVGSGFGNISQLSPVAKPQPETTHATNAYGQQAVEGNRVSLRRLLRVEFKGAQFNTAFQPQSVVFEGERLKVTLRSQSALIEGERFKIMLQPHSASMLWNKAF